MKQYTDEQFLNATAAVKQVEGYKESEAGGITPNEFAIINHYEHLLNERPTADSEAIKDIAYDISDFTYQLEFIRNYFSVLASNYKNNHDEISLARLHMTLYEDGALQNIDKVLLKGTEVLNKNSDDLLSTVGEE
ncbi:hypothetical protein [Enterococcus sp. BWR-S5]|uniref:hypothetical protein n=1 Tax=Enterococcus sp. BWR-S5 TaxID=2787714 RepID=UPI001920A822|nr:hypothetical protein [Enterococcus sp. BWR-S5]MBL1223716.1 hypothetical protein [Enterococcus sp. BWR-S5]